MPSWPLAADYTMMLQNPQHAFPQQKGKNGHVLNLLRESKVQRDKLNQPFGRSGQFAVVYKATLPDGRNIAVRAFTGANDERSERYRAISDYLDNYLHQLEQQPRPHESSLVHFQYHEKGIRARDGKKYPLVTMEWVAGDTLYDWVRHQCIQGQQQSLQLASDRWTQLVQELHSAQIAHGDLQHGNVMVDQQMQLKLVDYDCMCVPSLVGRRNLEIGVDPYQHPDRNESTPLSLALDNFSALFILVALRALAASPKLWNTFVEKDRYDKLLIRREDLEEPNRSALYDTLKKSPDKIVGKLTDVLFDLHRSELSNIPYLPEILRDIEFSWNQVGDLITQKQFDEAVQKLRARGNWNDAPVHLKQPIDNAFQRTECLQQLSPHVDAGNELGMKQHYKPPLLDDYPKAQPAVAIARYAAQVIPLLDEMTRARQQKNWPQLVKVWDGNQSLLSSRKSAQPFKTEVDYWRKRLRDWLDVQARLKAREFDRAVQLLDQMGKLDDMPAVLKPHVDNARQRVVCLAELNKQIQAGNEQATLAAYKPALLDDFPAAASSVALAKTAAQVLPILQQLTQARAQQQWRPLVSLWDRHDKLLAGRKSAAAFQGDVQLWRKRNQACDQLLALIGPQGTRVPQDISKLSAAWSALEAAGGHPEAEPHRLRITDLIQRDAAWTELQKALSQAASPSETSDSRLVDCWKPQLFNGWPQAQAVKASVDHATQRLERVRNLQTLAQRYPRADLAGEQQICALARELPTGYQHSQQSRVQAAQNRDRAWNRLQQALREPALESAIDAAWRELQGQQGDSMLDAAGRARVDQAQQRLPLLQRLGQLSTTQPPHQLDRALLDVWQDDLLRACHEAQGWVRAYDDAVGRRELLQQVRRAVQADQEGQVVDLLSDPLLNVPNYQLPSDLAPRLSAIRQRLRAADQLLEALQTNQLEMFREHFDARLIRRYLPRFSDHQDRLLRWTSDSILTAQQIGLQVPRALRGLELVPGSRVNYRLRWTFPDPRYAETCLVAVCPSSPGRGQSPRQLKLLWKRTVTHAQLEAGCLLPGGDEYAGSCVVVWALVDLGLGEELASEPLVLGRIPSRSGPSARPKRSGWF